MIIRCWNHKYSIIVEGSFHLPMTWLVSWISLLTNSICWLSTWFALSLMTIVPQRFNSVKNRVNAGFGSPATGNCLFASYCQVQSSLSTVSPYYLCRLDTPQPPRWPYFSLIPLFPAELPLSFPWARKARRAHRAVVDRLPIPSLCLHPRTERAQTAGTAQMQTISSGNGSRSRFCFFQEWVNASYLSRVYWVRQTLDALPAHLVTPFNGPIPPSNLLDKIARGVSQAKGPVDWPHSIRATRVKLIELSRLRAKEQAAANHRRESIAEEPEDAMEIEANYTYTQDGRQKSLGVAAGARRPLYRQSSMDFMLNAEETDKKNNEHLAR